MKKYLFVDEKQNIFTGEAAKAKLEKTSDKDFLDETKGVVKVTDERWKLAQRYEKHFWMETALSSNDDRNIEHYRAFEGYNTLQGMSFGSAIELGCGPFTNLRTIAHAVPIQSCTLEDPLIPSYLTHPHCTYNNSSLRTGDLALDILPVRILRRLLRPVLPKLANKLSFNAKQLKIKELIPLPIEDMQPGNKYDLVVMINVIEHCKDLQKIFDVILDLCASGSVFIFSDKYYYYKQISTMVNGECFEAGHPLLVDRKFVETFLHTHFTPMFEKVTNMPYEIKDFDWSYDSVYFIGKRK